MKIVSIAALIALVCALGSGIEARAAESAGREVSGTLTVDGKAIELPHAYLDETDPDEPIVVLSDQPLPPDAIPFIPEKLVEEKQLHAVAFSFSRREGKLTNTFGKLYAPGHEIGVGLGRVEDGNVSLTVGLIDDSGIEGRIATVKPVKLSYIAYSFDLAFRAPAAKAKK
ncbi:MAG TPA: hypothetical protein VKH46_04680 [Thermoanaerobaculia bacterium]|jgi:hypothetical protein|nr:hypothetical protein [Thermoanaerobaculia bacterium]